MLPAPDLVTALRSLERPRHPQIRWTTEDQWHVTLRFFASIDPDELLDAVDGADLPPSPIATAGPAPTALSNRVWVLPIAGLDALANAVGPDTRPFHGHLTLARARRPGALRGLPNPPIEASWTVDHIVAMRSELLPSGAVHHELGRWSLPPG